MKVREAFSLKDYPNYREILKEIETYSAKELKALCQKLEVFETGAKRFLVSALRRRILDECKGE